MTVLIEHYFNHPSAVRLDTCARDYLAANEVAAECIQSARRSDVDLSSCSVLISRGALSEELRSRIKCFGGRNLSRIETFEYVQRAGLDQMTWAAAETLADVDRLFDDWRTERLILKRSDTYKGLGLLMFSRPDLENLRWDPERDVFCTEVNRQDGTVAKVECCAGRLLCTWLQEKPPVNEILVDGTIDTEAYLSCVRVANAPLPEEIIAKARRCSALASRDGLGHISLDLMQSRNGRWKVIELNSQEVAVWWTAQFESVRRNYARAIHSLVTEFDTEGPD